MKKSEKHTTQIYHTISKVYHTISLSCMNYGLVWLVNKLLPEKQRQRVLLMKILKIGNKSCWDPAHQYLKQQCCFFFWTGMLCNVINISFYAFDRNYLHLSIAKWCNVSCNAANKDTQHQIDTNAIANH